jgi:hypothetical protein
MSLTRQPAWLRRTTRLGILLHVLIVLTAPFEHHDLLCHLKTPTHCTACVSSPLAASPRPIEVVGAWSLHDAGSAVEGRPALHAVVLTTSSGERSPPTL